MAVFQKKRRAGRGGFTLVEVLIAVLVLTVAIVPLMTAYIHGARWTAEARDLITAVNLAQGKLEELKNRAYHSLEAGEPTDPEGPPGSFPGHPEYVYRVAVFETDLSGDGEPDVKTVTVAVYEAAHGADEVVSLTMDRGKWR